MTRKLCLGCGPYKIPGYINLDINPLQQPDIVRDVRKGLPYDTSSIEEVLASHFLEHLSPPEVLDLIEEVYRVLVPGGQFKIAVPLGITGGLDHWSSYCERSLDHLWSADEGGPALYYHRSFLWELESKEILQDDPIWCTETLHVVLRAVKDQIQQPVIEKEQE